GPGAHRRVGSGAGAVKRRLHEAPLCEMQRALAGQQTAAEQTSGPFETAPFQEIALVGNQDIFDELWMVEQEQMLGRRVDVGDVAVAPRGMAETCKWHAARASV